MPTSGIPSNVQIMSGRSVLRTNLTGDNLTQAAIKEDLARVLPMHSANRQDIRELQDYHKGYHPYIQTRKKTVRTDVDNKITANLAWSTTRDITGYFLGKPIQYAHRKGMFRVQMEHLIGALDAENKALVDKQIADDCSICGVGYRGIFQDSAPRNGTHLSLLRLEPQDTFVVYPADPTKPPVYAVTFYDSAPSSAATAGTTGDPRGAVRYYQVYTANKFFTFKDVTVNGQDATTGGQLEFVEEKDILFGGGLPIVEYPNNLWRMGDWETAVALMDAIDCVTSDGVNDIQQAVNSILVALGFEMSDETFKTLSTNGFLNISNIPPGVTPKADFISQPMDSTVGTAMRDYLEAMFRMIVGVPDRKNRPGGGGDTGDAVFMRDGWQDIDLVAAGKEPYFVQAEREALFVILYILDTNKEVKSLKATDIEIHFNRNKTANMQSKAQVYQTLTSGEAALDPADALDIAGLTHNVHDVIMRAESYQGKMREIRKQAQIDANAAKDSKTKDKAAPGDKGGTAKAGSSSTTE